MFQKLKDGANKLKAKIGGDDLDEKLVEVVSEENWQASTQQLHEIANAAYNYQKWQRINQFIWDKLKKSKSWKKILKTFNLIEFLLKNGPPSIISNFKYDLYQLRTFESYSNYIDGLDKGQPIRERAKVIVNLLGNQELLEEQRVKAKTIRQKMSNVVGGTSYGSGYGGSYNNNSSYGGSNGYGGSSGNGGSGYGSQKAEEKKKNDSYNYGSGLGYFGDYTYTKSTLDKYKDPKNDKPSTVGPSNETKKQQKKTAATIEVQTKKPFEKIASKLSKPGEKKETLIAEEPTAKPQTNQSKTEQNSIIEFDIFGGETTKPAQPTSVPFSFDSTPVPQIQAPTLPPQPIIQAPFVSQPQVPVQAPINPPVPTQQPFNYGQQTQPYIQGQPYQPQYPNQFGGNQQFGAYNQFSQQQPNFNYPQNPQNPQPFGTPAPQNFGQQGGYNPYINPMYPTTAPLAVNQGQKAANVNMGITLNTKKEQQFGAFSSNNAGTAQNVNWLSNTEKGLIDFSDFGSEIKKETKPANKQISNNIQIDTTWSW